VVMVGPFEAKRMFEGGMIPPAGGAVQGQDAGTDSRFERDLVAEVLQAADQGASCVAFTNSIKVVAGQHIPPRAWPLLAVLEHGVPRKRPSVAGRRAAIGRTAPLVAAPFRCRCSHRAAREAGDPNIVPVERACARRIGAGDGRPGSGPGRSGKPTREGNVPGFAVRLGT
jgi:hypothetical protein